MQFVILGLLHGGALSLYDVRKRFAADLALFYSASLGSIQRALAVLVADGSITVEADETSTRGRLLHTLTDRGRMRFRAWMLAPIAASTESETTILAKVFLLGVLDDADDRRAVLDAARDRVHDDLDLLRKTAEEVDVRAAIPGAVPAALQRRFGYQRATLAYGLGAHAHALAWIDDLRRAEA